MYSPGRVNLVAANEREFTINTNQGKSVSIILKNVDEAVIESATLGNIVLIFEHAYLIYTFYLKIITFNILKERQKPRPL